MDGGNAMNPTFLARAGASLAVLLGTSAMFAAAALIGLVVLVLLFRLGVFAGIDILFYRGVVLCALSFAITVALLAWLGHATRRLSFRDAIAAGFLSVGLNLSVLVIAPVTVDRSISVFILGYMAAHDGQAFTTRDIEGAFRDIYLGRLQQIERRMDEQRQSGNVVERNGAYVISPQGLSFVSLARRVGWLFGADPRLVDQKPARESAAAGR
jgi:hypothetical protein